jgi:hypothetical protein
MAAESQGDRQWKKRPATVKGPKRKKTKAKTPKRQQTKTAKGKTAKRTKAPLAAAAPDLFRPPARLAASR